MKLGSFERTLLKGPKHEKFVAGITQIRPVWIGELEIKPKSSKN